MPWTVKNELCTQVWRAPEGASPPPGRSDGDGQATAAAGDQQGFAQVTSILADAFPFGALLQFETAAALIELGRLREAVRYSSRAVEIEPRVVNHWLVHAHGLLLSGRTDEGRAALQRALELEPTNPTALQVLAEIEGN
jgi:Flp pilus assembly protein TadD